MLCLEYKAPLVSKAFGVDYDPEKYFDIVNLSAINFRYAQKMGLIQSSFPLMVGFI